MNRGDIKLVIDQLNSIDMHNPDSQPIDSAITMLGELSDKVAQQEKQIQHLQMALADVEALEAGTSERYMTLKKQVADSKDVITEQAAVIEKLRDALIECEGMVDELRHYPVTHDSIIEALTIPTDSKQILFTHPPAPSVVEGYQLVPIEPTAAMVEAGANVDPERESVWAAMLSAARSE